MASLSEQLTGLSSEHLEELSFEEDSFLLHPEAKTSFLSMMAAAKKEGFDLRPCSAYRSFDRQLTIWNRKASGDLAILDLKGQPLDVNALPEEGIMHAILRWSALPGLSRHHWGTDLDVYDAAALKDGEKVQLIPEESAPGGPFERLHRWLDENMATFGFFRPYAEDRGGVSPEPWHLSFEPLATGYLDQFEKSWIESALSGAELLLKEPVLASLDEILHRYFHNHGPSK